MSTPSTVWLYFLALVHACIGLCIRTMIEYTPDFTLDSMKSSAILFFTHAYNYVSCASTSVSRNAIMWRVIQPRSHIPAHVYTRVLVYPYTLTPRYVWIAWSQPHYSQIHASRFVYTHTVRTLYELASTKSGAHNMRSSILPHLGPGAERLRVHTESRMSIHKRTDACHQMCLTRPRHLHTLVHSSFHITLHV